jgi:hypothetical protein
MSLSILSRRNKEEPSHLRDINEHEIFVLRQHLHTDGKHYCLRRNFRLYTIHGLTTCRNYTDIVAECYFADLLNKFITDEGKDESKTSDEKVMEFFVYAYEQYGKIEYLDQNNAEAFIKKLIDFNPKFFNDKHLNHSYKYEIYLLFVKLAEHGLDVEYKEVKNEK